MKKTLKVIIISITSLSMIFSIFVFAFADTNNNRTIEEIRYYYELKLNSERDLILKECSGKNFSQILSEIKKAENENLGEEILGYLHIALGKKMADADKNQITDAILDTELSAASRVTIIISAQVNEISLDYERLNEAIGDDRYEDIRPMLIELIAEVTPDNIDEIEKIVKNKSKGFSMAIKTLFKIKPSEAISVADEILANYSGEYDEIFRGAFSVKSYQAMLAPEENLYKFIALCNKIHNTPCDDYEEREIFISSWLQEIYCLGDINYDCRVTAADARLVMNYSSMLETDFDRYQLFVADVNGDGAITAADSRLIMNYSAGLITIFPADPLSS